MFFDPSFVVEEHVFATSKLTEQSVDYWQTAQEWSSQLQDVVGNLNFEQYEQYVPKLMTYSGVCLALVAVIIMMRISYWFASKCYSKIMGRSSNLNVAQTTPRGSGCNGWIHTIIMRLTLFIQQIKLWLLKKFERLLNTQINVMTSSMSMFKFGHRGDYVDQDMLRRIANHIEKRCEPHDQVIAMCNYTISQISIARTRGDYMHAQQLTAIHDQLSSSLTQSPR